MSRTGARDKARRQLTETMAVLSQAVSLLSKSRVVLKRSRSADAAECLAMIESFCSCPLPTHPNQHPDNLAVDQFATAMKTKLAEGRTKGWNNWDKPWVKDEQLAELLVENLPKGNPGNFEDIANFAMMLHQRGADPLKLTLAYNRQNSDPDLTPPKDGNELVILIAVAKANDTRYRYLRERNLDAISKGGVFAGKTPDNVVLNLDDLDRAIDIALAEAVKP